MADPIGVVGGSGFYAFLDDVEEIVVDTPWGAPSGPVAVGDLDGRSVAFLPRHGRHHHVPPHRVNARANLWALRELGVRRVIGPCAAGSLRPDLPPGRFVVCDQLVDRTWGRPDTYFDGPVVNHVSFADPYCPELRRTILRAGSATSVPVVDGGTVVVIQGPRFSTRAESAWFREQGWSVVNMTQHPEAYLARELGLCYATIALVTDYDAGVEGEPGIEPVSYEVVLQMMGDNVARVRALLAAAIPTIPAEASCACASAPNGLVPGPPAS